MSRAKNILVVSGIFLFAVSGCAKKKPAELPPPPPSYQPPAQTPSASADDHGAIITTGTLIVNPRAYWTVPVYFGTDRERSGGGSGTARVPVSLKSLKSVRMHFGGQRALQMTYGMADVTVPNSHRVGKIERPDWYHLEFTDNKNSHFTIASATKLSSQEWVRKIARDTARTAKRPLLLFIHGYNVSFDDALYRTAQIAFDLRFPGPVVLFSWPSEAKLLGYTVDETMVEFSEPDLVQMITIVLKSSGADNIYIIGHSMGSRILTRALIDIANDNPSARTRIKDVILAAPDIDAEVFKRSIAPEMYKVTQGITLYASSGDEALRASHFVNGYRRAGDTNGGVIVYPPIVTIDASSEKSDFLGHSYISESPRVLSDVGEIITSQALPAARGLIRVNRGSEIYWRFPE